ncbi:MAG TPA: MarR family transcriptional regulator [Dehalococcoidia bacterium]|nr:MarR family transcriptional regulator [Dehalococcoidia bacterium]
MNQVREPLGTPDDIALKYQAVCQWADLPALQVNLWIVEAYRSLVAGLHRVLDSVEPGMSAPRFLALRDLYLTPGHRLTQGDIQRRGKTTSGSVTRLVDSLEQEGLIVRRPNLTDRRTNYVELTPRGVELCHRLIPAVARYSVDVCTEMDEADRQRFVNLLKALSSGAEQSAAQSAASQDYDWD